MALTLGNPLLYPLHVITWRPDGSRDYRVTNPFNGPDFLNGGIHRATDVGNFRMNDAVRAPAAGRALARRHADSALGVIFDLGSGITLQLWHLNAVSIPLERWTPVARGQAVGVTGNSGARLPDGSPMPAHTHISAERNGTPFDIERYLPMVERPAIPLEDDMRLPAGLSALTYAVLGPNNRIRVSPETADGSRVTAAEERVQVFALKDVPAAPWTIGGQSGTEWWFVGSGLDTGWVAKPLIRPDYTPLGRATLPAIAADCSAQEQTIAQLAGKIDRARTANRGAAQAQQAVEGALA